MAREKEIIIAFMTDRLKEGISGRASLKAEVGAKWQTSDRTFDRYWAAASAAHIEFTSRVNLAKEDTAIEEEVEAVKSGLRAKIHRQKELEDMLAPEYLVEEKIVKDGKAQILHRKLRPAERVMIHRELSLMDGSYTPKKLRIGGDSGAPPIKHEVAVQVKTYDFNLSLLPLDLLKAIYRHVNGK